jgi:hypothetical protein
MMNGGAVEFAVASQGILAQLGAEFRIAGALIQSGRQHLDITVVNQETVFTMLYQLRGAPDAGGDDRERGGK